MKKRIFKKISGILLSMLMVMTMTPAMAFADTAPDEDGADSNGIIYPTVNYTDVAPFLAPVEGEVASDSSDSEQSGATSYSAMAAIAKTVRAAAIQTYSLDNNITTYADDSEGDITEGGGTTEPDNGMSISKTATANSDGTYTIQLEAYATGSKVISEVTKDVPTDIVLVLDQSGSMEDPIGTVSFEAYTGKNAKNSNLYKQRHNNGGNSNLYYPLVDGSYAPVHVKVDETRTYTELKSLKNYTSSRGNVTSDCYFYYKDNLYEKLGDEEYSKVTLTRSNSGTWWNPTYTYTYTFSDDSTVTSTGDNSRPNLGDHAPLYTYSVDDVYTYTYTDENGNTHTIGTSTGANTTFGTTLYQKVVNTKGGVSRLEALQTAVTNFSKSVADKAAGEDKELGTDDDIQHRIAVVGYASRADSNSPWINTEVFIGDKQYNYNVDASNYYASAFQNMSTEMGKNNVANSIGALDANGATYTNYGLEMANGIINANPLGKGEKRNRVIILFSDGYPGKNADDFNATAANDALEQATTAKNAGISLYSVGIFAGADATTAGNKDGTNTQAANWFMQNVSSNNGTPQTPSYYLSASDADTLNNIFQQISEQIESGGSSTTLSDKTVIKDIISPQFTLPEGATANNITLETYSCTGVDEYGKYTWKKNTDAMGATASIDDEVSVTGFDFSANYVGTETAADGNVTYRGNKLVISFEVSPKEGFLGGNNVYTNTSAGVYENSEAENPVMTFERPEVNVPIEDVTVTASDKNVYLLEDLTADQLKAGATVKVGDVKLDLAKENYGLETWQNDYVDITVEIQDKNGNVVNSSLSALREDTTYTIYVKVAPKEGNKGEGASGTPATEKTGVDEATINVFKPVVTFKDSEVYYGESGPDSYNNIDEEVGIVWKHNGIAAPDNMGMSPEIAFTYTPDANCLTNGIITTKQDVPVDVGAKIGDQAITQYVTFNHTNCSGDETLPNGAEFLLHVRTCSLTIEKTGGTDGEPYVFDVYKDGKLYTSLTISGSGSETISELPVGTYSVRENTDWSWRYNSDTSTPNYTSDVTLTKDDDSGTITVTNHDPFIYWLNGYSSIVKNVYGENNNQ